MNGYAEDLTQEPNKKKPQGVKNWRLDEVVPGTNERPEAIVLVPT